jgi:multidrug efflux system outer membrane protein
MMGPNYKRPEIETPNAYRVEVAPVNDLINTTWWEAIQRSGVERLIKTALAENKDVRIAAARIEEFLGRYGVTRSQLFPQVATQFNAGSQRISNATQPGLAAGQNNTFDTYSLDIGVAWEIDLWGKFRRATEAARADLLATDEARQTGDPLAYYGRRNLVCDADRSRPQASDRQEHSGCARRKLPHHQTALRRWRCLGSRCESGALRLRTHAVDHPAVRKANRAAGERACRCCSAAIRVRSVRASTLDQLVLPQVPADLPSSLLERRPDLRSSEQQLIAANARIGVAKAQFFPTISLTAFLGTAAPPSAISSAARPGPGRTAPRSRSLSSPVAA